jgi:hypothetical protein
MDMEHLVQDLELDTLCYIQGKKEKKGKKKKDPTADRSIESLFAELVSNGILQPCPHVHVRDFVGSSSFMQATLEKVRHRPCLS